MTLEKRLDNLERRAHPGGLCVVGVGQHDWSEAELDAAVTAALAGEPPGTKAIKVHYVKDWRPGDTVIAVRGGFRSVEDDDTTETA